MNIVRKIVKETLLVPKHIVEGVWDAVDETINGSKAEKPVLKEKRS